MALKIFGSARSRAMRTLWIAAELQLTFEHAPWSWDDPRLKEPAFLALNPAGTITTIVDEGFALSESMAISLYLAKKYGREQPFSLYPGTLESEAQVWRWSLWAQGHIELGCSAILMCSQYTKPAKKTFAGYCKSSSARSIGLYRQPAGWWTVASRSRTSTWPGFFPLPARLELGSKSMRISADGSDDATSGLRLWQFDNGSLEGPQWVRCGRRVGSQDRTSPVLGAGAWLNLKSALPSQTIWPASWPFMVSSTQMIPCSTRPPLSRFGWRCSRPV